ncbi:MAG: hypothetical protein AAFU64_21065, partial [Bacteroidota bacterium]
MRGEATRTSTGDISVDSTLTLSGKAALDLNGFVIEVDAATTLNDASITGTGINGTLLFNGGVSLQQGAQFNINMSSGEVQLAEAIVNQGSQFQVTSPLIALVKNTEDFSFLGNSRVSLTGNVELRNNVRVTNDIKGVEILITGNLLGNGVNWQQGADAILEYRGQAPPLPNGGFSAEAAGNTVIYARNDNLNQNLRSVNYHHLSLQGNGNKILNADVTIGGDFSSSSNPRFDVGSNNITINGNWDNQGSLINHNGEIQLLSDGTTFSNPKGSI